MTEQQTVKHITRFHLPLCVVLGKHPTTLRHYCGELVLSWNTAPIIIAAPKLTRDVMGRLLGYKADSVTLHIITPEDWSAEEYHFIGHLSANLQTNPHFGYFNVTYNQETESFKRTLITSVS